MTSHKTLLLARALGYVASMDTEAGYNVQRVIAARPGAPFVQLFNPRANLQQFAEVFMWLVVRNAVDLSVAGGTAQGFIETIINAAEELAAKEAT